MTGPMPERRRGIFDRLGEGLDRLVGLPAQGLLDPATRSTARQRGLLALGTSLLRASQPQPRRVGTLAGIGTAIEAAQAGTLGSIEEQLALGEKQRQLGLQQRQQEILGRFQGQNQSDPAVLRQLMTELLSVGDSQGAQTVANVLNSLGGAEAQKLTEVDLGDRVQLVNPVTGEVVREVPKGETPGKSAQEQFTRTSQLLRSFMTDTKDEQDIALSFAALQTAASDPSPAGDIAVIFAFMKMIDPGSTVREGEFATAENSGSVPRRIWALYNRLLTDEGRLDEGQRADFVSQARARAASTQEGLQRKIARFTRTAERFGVEPTDVVFDPFVGLLDDTPGGLTQNPTGQWGDVLDRFIPRR